MSEQENGDGGGRPPIKEQNDHEDNSEGGENESVYSMDSFLADLPPEPEEIMRAADREAQRFMSYLSPSSATTESDVSRSQPLALPPSQVSAVHQETIDSVAPHETIDRAPARKMSSDAGSLSDSLPNIPPAHPFFSPSYYEDQSDLSDGSLVFNSPEAQGQQPQQTSSKSKKSAKHRDRFPSF